MNWQNKTERLKLILCGFFMLAVIIFVVSSSSVRSGAREGTPEIAPARAEGLPEATNKNGDTKARAGEPTATSAENAPVSAPAQPVTTAPTAAQPAQTPAASVAKEEGCIACHQMIEPMHRPRAVQSARNAFESGTLDGSKDGQGLTCTYCHGGNPNTTEKKDAHVKPRYPSLWERYKKQDTNSSANPEASHALLANESYEFVRFVNPGDLRVAEQTCASCHSLATHANHNSLMRTGSMLWAAALYNNGMYPLKDSTFGESYAAESGAPERIIQPPHTTYPNAVYDEKTQTYTRPGLTSDGSSTRIYDPTPYNMWAKGILSYLDPLPRWEISQPGNTLRVFERGGKRRLEVALSDKEEEPGKPDKGLSPRGFGTQQRTDPVYLGLQKTRLLDPTMNFLGTNDFPGDYRSSGCTACHVVYNNDRSPVHSGDFYTKTGCGPDGKQPCNDHHGRPGTVLGTKANYERANDPNSSRDLSKESGHPVRHQFTQRIPTSQCMVCHMHPGNNMETTYMGFIWWDNETDGDKMYDKEYLKKHEPSQDEEQVKLNRNPEGSSLRGKWGTQSSPSDRTPDGDAGYQFMSKTGEPGAGKFNDDLKRTQFADFHGHGWMFRAIFKRDKRGNFIDSTDKPINESEISGKTLREAVEYRDKDNYNLTSDGPAAGKPVHLKDIHLEKGMHCVDCHFVQDSHGNGNLYNEPRAAIEITCADCHGTTTERADLFTGGPASETSDKAGRDLTNLEGTDNTRIFRGRRPTAGQTLPGGNGGAARLKEPAQRLPDPYNPGKNIDLQPGDIVQFSYVEPGLWWRVKQTVDTVTEGNRDYNWKSAYAKTIKSLGAGGVDPNNPIKWGGGANNDEKSLAHSDSKVSCFTCHSAWMTSCFGCHLSMEANRKMPNRHSEGVEGGNTRNFTTYNYQVIRDDVFMLGRDGTAASHRPDGKGGQIYEPKISPVASRSAVLVSSQNQNREWIYSQQQTISAEGFAGQAFNTHVPHTVRANETKDCDDCHLSEQNDNNAWLAQTYLHGTNYVNFIGRYLYVAAEHALEVFPVTEHDEPQAVKGSSLHKIAYPGQYEKFVKGGKEIKTFFEHVGNPEVLQVHLRGEYAYVAAGKGGLRVYDVAQIDHKGFSERMVTAPVSRFGQKFWVPSKYATAVASPSTLANDPLRNRLMRAAGKPDKWVYMPDIYNVAATGQVRATNPVDTPYLEAYRDYRAMSKEQREKTPNPLVNEEQLIHPVYAFLYVVDKEEGLILVGAGTLLDGDPLNNYLKRAPIKDSTNSAWNPGGVLTGANNIITAGNYAYITTEDKLVIVDLSKVNPFGTSELSVVKEIPLKQPKSVAVQFRYAFVVDKEGMKVIDVTTPEKPDTIKLVEGAFTPLGHAHSIYVARTYAYIGNGSEGVAIVDITNPEKPGEVIKFDGGGKLDDVHDVKVGMTNASVFAYVANGKHGVEIIELMTPELDTKYGGFSPKIDASKLRIIAHMHTSGPAVHISKGLDRDRASDESGNQVSVFGRRGSRPLNLEEQRKLYVVRGTDKVFRVPHLGNMTQPPQPATAGNMAHSTWGRFTAWFGGMIGLMVIAGFGWRRFRRK